MMRTFQIHACHAVALAKEGEKTGNATDLQLLQKTFDRMK
jgi:hypothetical protein